MTSEKGTGWVGLGASSLQGGTKRAKKEAKEEGQEAHSLQGGLAEAQRGDTVGSAKKIRF